MSEDSSTSHASFLHGGGQMGALIRATDWTSTSLGSPENWPQALKTTVRIILTAQQPMFVWWGKELINLYNDAYSVVIGDKHPKALGRPAQETWAEIWPDIGPRAMTVMNDNTGTYDETLLLLMNRSGYMEETYFTFSYSPIMGDDGVAQGLFCANTDETNRVLGERQLRTVRELSRNVIKTKSNRDVYRQFLETLQENPKDFPFVVIYEVSEDGESLEMCGKHPADLPESMSQSKINLAVDADAMPELAEVVQTGTTKMVEGITKRFGVVPSGFWDKSPDSALLIPIMRNNTTHPFAVLAVGINPYRRPNKNYLSFFQLIADQLGTALSNVYQLKSARAKNHYDRQLRNLFLQAPIAISVLRGPEFIVDTVNERMVEIWGKAKEELVGKPIFTAMPDARRQGFEELLTNVYETGESYVSNESYVELIRKGKPEGFYVKFIYKPLRDEDENVSGIMVLADDITEQVEVRKSIEVSEARNKLAIEAAEIGTFEWIIPDENFIYSDRLAQIFGFNETQNLTQADFSELIHPDDFGIRQSALIEAMRTGVLFYETRFIQPDNSIIWVRLNGKVIYAEDGSPYKMYGTVRDISDHKIHSYILEKKVEDRTRNLQRKNEELKQSEERYQRMTEEVQDYAILLLDTEGTILNWNKGAENIKGYREDEIVGKNISIFYRPQDQKINLPKKMITEAKVNGRAQHEGYRVRKDGTIFWGSITVTALHDDSGKVIGFSKVTRDLTEKKIADDKIKKYNAELEFQNRELEQFAFVASHDLQEPLRKIQMFADMLERNLHDEEAVKKYFSKINSSAERMSELIRAVLNYSRLSRIDQHFENTDLSLILQNVLTDFELLIEEKHAVVITEKLPSIKAIPLQVNQLFSNLIGNALKFSETAPEIRISYSVIGYKKIPYKTNLSPDVDYLRLVFSDNGIGFDQKYASQIFTIFQRLNEKAAFSGTGIGLALCKKIVENHHGFIAAKSAPGEGATFEIFLPYIDAFSAQKANNTL